MTRPVTSTSVATNATDDVAGSNPIRRSRNGSSKRTRPPHTTPPIKIAATGPAVRPMPNAVMTGDRTAVVTYPVDVWFGGSRTFRAELDFGGRAIERIVLDPRGRFPDRVPEDNVWPVR